jgi:hypothetical protein
MTGNAARIAYTYADAAEATGVSIDVIRRAVRAGDLVPAYPTTRPVLLADDLRDWLRACPSESPGVKGSAA